MSQLWQSRKPFSRPLFRTIRPGSLPSSLSRRISQDDKAFTLDLDSFDYGIRDTPIEAVDAEVLDTTTVTIQFFEPTAKETVIIGFDEFVMPEFISIKDVLNVKKNKKKGRILVFFLALYTLVK